MTPADLLASLTAAGFRLRVEGGKLLVAPIAKLSAEQRSDLADHREAMIALLADRPDEATLTALAERAYLDPPDFDAGGVVFRDSVVLRLEGFPPIAVSPAEAESLDRSLADAGRYRERQEARRKAREQAKVRAASAKQVGGLGLGAAGHEQERM